MLESGVRVSSIFWIMFHFPKPKSAIFLILIPSNQCFQAKFQEFYMIFSKYCRDYCYIWTWRAEMRYLYFARESREMQFYLAAFLCFLEKLGSWWERLNTPFHSWAEVSNSCMPVRFTKLSTYLLAVTTAVLSHWCELPYSVLYFIVHVQLVSYLL